MGIEDIIYFAVDKGSKPMKEIIISEKVTPGAYLGQPILYNINKITCPFVGGKQTGPNYSDMTELKADWYKANTKYRQFTAFSKLTEFYGNKLLFFGAGYVDCDRQKFPKYVQPGVKAEKAHYEKMKRIIKRKPKK